MKNIDLEKIQTYVRDNVELYKGMYGFFTCNTTKYDTYFITIVDKNYSSDTLKKFRPGFLKKLRSINALYFLSAEIGSNHAFHFHISVIVPKGTDLISIINKYMRTKSTVTNFSTIDIDIKKIKNIKNYKSHYLIKKFNTESFKSSDFDSKEFRDYISSISKHIRVYSMFSTNI